MKKTVRRRTEITVETLQIRVTQNEGAEAVSIHWPIEAEVVQAAQFCANDVLEPGSETELIGGNNENEK